MTGRPYKLYHYTSRHHLEAILSERKLKLTSSNLLEPKNPHLENGVLVDETDSYKPCLWATDRPYFDSEKKVLIVPSIRYDKTEVRVTLLDTTSFVYWDDWAKENKMNPSWRRRFIKGTNYSHWWISEQEYLLIRDTAIIEYRPDIARELPPIIL